MTSVKADYREPKICLFLIFSLYWVLYEADTFNPCSKLIYQNAEQSICTQNMESMQKILRMGIFQKSKEIQRGGANQMMVFIYKFIVKPQL
jgi:hypothetical protein